MNKRRTVDFVLHGIFLSSLSFSYHPHHLYFPIFIIFADELHSSVLPLTVGVSCFFPCIPFSSPCRSQLPFAENHIPLRTGVIYGAYWQYSVPGSFSTWALLAFQPLLWFFMLFKELLPAVLPPWLQAVVHICAACCFWLLLPAAFCRNKAAINMTVFRVNRCLKKDPQ